MLFKKIATLTLAAAFALPAVAQNSSPAKDSAKAHHILFALSSGDQQDWDMVLANMHNMLAAYPAGSAEFELVAFGPGITFLTKDSTAVPGIHELEQQHVHFVACRNAMKAHHITDGDLAQGVTTVPSGLIEVVDRQEKGWSYIKGGR